MTFTESQATSNGCTCAGRDTGVKGIDIEREVDRTLTLAWCAVEVIEGHFDDLADAILVGVVHAEGLDVVLLEDLALAGINVSQADVHQAVRTQERLLGDPRVEGLHIRSLQPEQERDRAAVQISRFSGLGRVDIGVSIDPDECCLRMSAQ